MLIRNSGIVGSAILLVVMILPCRSEDAFSLQPVKHQVEVLKTTVDLRTALTFYSIKMGKTAVIDAKIVTDITDFEKKFASLIHKAVAKEELIINRDLTQIEIKIDKVNLISKKDRLTARLLGSFSNISLATFSLGSFEKTFEMHVPLDFALSDSGSLVFVPARPSIVFHGVADKVGAYLGYWTGTDYKKNAEDTVEAKLKQLPSFPIPALQKLSPRMISYRTYREKTGGLTIEVRGGIEVPSTLIDPYVATILTSFSPPLKTVSPKAGPSKPLQTKPFTPARYTTLTE